MNVRKKAALVEQPAFELTVRSGQVEICTVAFFEAEGNEWDVLVGIDTPSHRRELQALFEFAAQAVDKAAWRPLDAAGDVTSTQEPGW